MQRDHLGRIAQNNLLIAQYIRKNVKRDKISQMKIWIGRDCWCSVHNLKADGAVLSIILWSRVSEGC